MPIVLALMSALVYGMSDYFGGRAARTAPLLAVTLLAQAAAIVTATVVVVVGGDSFPSGADVAWSIAAGLSSTLAAAAFYFALANGAMTLVAPITAVVSALVPVFVGVATGERPSLLAVAGIVAALVAVALISGLTGHVERATAGRIVVLAVCAGAGFGLLFVFLDRTRDDSGLWPPLLGQAAVFPLLASLVVARRIPVCAVGRVAPLALGAGVFGIVANVCYLSATRQGLLSLVAVITAMYPVSTVALATILDDERMSRSQVVGVVFAGAALVLVATGT